MPPVGLAISKNSRAAGIAQAPKKSSAIAAQSAPTTSRRVPGWSSSAKTIARPETTTVAAVALRAWVRSQSKAWRASR